MALIGYAPRKLLASDMAVKEVAHNLGVSILTLFYRWLSASGSAKA